MHFLRESLSVFACLPAMALYITQLTLVMQIVVGLGILGIAFWRRE